MYGQDGNDTILPGPDGVDTVIQRSTGELGNDTFILLVGETANCQEV